MPRRASKRGCLVCTTAVVLIVRTLLGPVPCARCPRVPCVQHACCNGSVHARPPRGPQSGRVLHSRATFNVHFDDLTRGPSEGMVGRVVTVKTRLCDWRHVYSRHWHGPDIDTRPSHVQRAHSANKPNMCQPTARAAGALASTSMCAQRRARRPNSPKTEPTSSVQTGLPPTVIMQLA